jgi:predicted nucleic acid-binding Zn ribbon protein
MTSSTHPPPPPPPAQRPPRLCVHCGEPIPTDRRRSHYCSEACQLATAEDLARDWIGPQ